jgi:2-iminobutanoate/2-iminopropanoate deaminase
MRHIVKTDEAPLPVGAYSQGVMVSGLIFTAGQIGLDPRTGKIAGDLEKQTEMALSNIQAVLEAAGSGMDWVVKMNLYITDMSDFETVNRIYSGRFRSPYPARSVVEVSGLPLGALVEIEAVAKIGRGTT